jgi:hypothetical protein
MLADQDAAAHFGGSERRRPRNCLGCGHPGTDSIRAAFGQVAPLERGSAQTGGSTMRLATFVTVAAAAALGALVMDQALGKDEFKPTVKFAKSWEKAIEEAKALNVPIVVHCHGVY